MRDPRFQNDLPPANSLSSYLKDYAHKLEEALCQVPEKKIEDAYAILKRALANKSRIYVAGNGGSSAIADHLCCDWMKGTFIAGQPTVKVHSLTSNSALFTALANDFGYEHSISRQIEMLGDPNDVVVLISSSGNSRNIIEAAQAAIEKKMTVIGMSGFSGGKLNEISHTSLYVPVHNYGIVEDAHQVLMHVLSQFLARERDSSHGASSS